MESSDGHRSRAVIVERLRQAINDHNLEAVVDCFAPTYRNETPIHPERDFAGQGQVRRNWQQILASIPDITAQVLRCTVDGTTVWSEWEQRGTRHDGTEHHMRGVVIFGVADGRAAWARFYLEPVDDAGDRIDAAVRRQVAPADGRMAATPVDAAG